MRAHDPCSARNRDWYSWSRSSRRLRWHARSDREQVKVRWVAPTGSHSLKLPDHIGVSQTVLSAIAQRYDGPPDGPFTRLPENGIFNAHYALGPRLVLRVPRDHPEHFAALRREAVAVPAVRKA